MNDLSQLDDDALLARARSGTDESQIGYGELVRRHQGWLVSLVARLMAVRAHEAEDLAQEAFVRTYVGLAEMPPGVNFRAWVRVAALRLAYNERRNRQTRARLRSTMPPPQPTESSAASLSAREVLQDILSKLSYPYREILVLRHLEELPLEEIAATLDLGLSAAKMRLKRAREAFITEHEKQGAAEDTNNER